MEARITYCHHVFIGLNIFLQCLHLERIKYAIKVLTDWYCNISQPFSCYVDRLKLRSPVAQGSSSGAPNPNRPLFRKPWSRFSCSIKPWILYIFYYVCIMYLFIYLYIYLFCVHSLYLSYYDSYDLKYSLKRHIFLFCLSAETSGLMPCFCAQFCITCKSKKHFFEKERYPLVKVMKYSETILIKGANGLL